MSDLLDLFDLSNCDREPIHIPGSIQPAGFLIAVTSDWMIARVSANVSAFLGHEPDTMIGRPVTDFIPGQTIHDLRNRTAALRGPNAVERLTRCVLVENAAPFDVAIHFSAKQIVIEAEPSSEDVGDVSGTVRSMVSRLDQCEDMTTFLREGARQLRALLGYDRVMVYRFAEEGSGEVAAESCRAGIGRFHGLRYPATDIPAQARELYKRNLLRIISNVRGEMIPVVPRLDEHKQPLDLSLSTLRAVSPIHLEYLRNMGVDASLSISIMVGGRLWGLFACHHYAPKWPAFARRSVAELFAQMFSMRLESREGLAVVEYERRARDVSDQLLSAVATDETLLRDPDWLGDILTSVIDADGVGVWINGKHASSGTTPDAETFRRIVRALNGTASGRIFATDRIGSIVKGAEAFVAEAAGMLAIPISRTPRDYVILFRRELVRSVRWGGDPHKPIEYGPNGPRLTPRESFAEWKELVRGRSLPFTESELRVAETLRATLIEVVLRLADEALNWPPFRSDIQA